MYSWLNSGHTHTYIGERWERKREKDIRIIPESFICMYMYVCHRRMCAMREQRKRERKKGVVEPAMALPRAGVYYYDYTWYPLPEAGPASQPVSQPAKLSLLSFPILILFLPGRSGRHISRSGHKIHSPFQSPLPPPRLPHPLPVRGKRDGDRGRELPLFVCLSSSTLFFYFPSYFFIPSLFLSPPAERLCAGLYY